MAQVHLYEYHGRHASPHRCTSSVNFGAGDVVIEHPDESPLARSSYSYEKWLRVVVTGIKWGDTLSNFRVWMTKAVAIVDNNDVIRTSAVSALYSPTTYRNPIATASPYAINVMPQTDPGVATIGINGALTNAISRASTYTMSDFFVIQAQVAADTITPISWTLHIGYD